MTEHGPVPSDRGDAPAESTPPRKPRGNRKPPRGKKNPRATAAVMERRILLVMQLLIEGKRSREIRRILADTEPSCKRLAQRTLEHWIAAATAELSKIADEPRAVAKSKVRARYELVIAKASEAKQWEIVRKATRDLARLDGLEAATRVSVGGSIETTHSGTVEHTHTHTVSGSIEERATRLTDLLNTAHQRRLAGQVPPASTNN